MKDNEQFINKAREVVRNWYNDNSEYHIYNKDIYVVWFCKTLQNWKALVSTDCPDGLYMEVTFNGDNNETYLDVYEKKVNEVIR